MKYLIAFFLILTSISSLAIEEGFLGALNDYQQTQTKSVSVEEDDSPSETSKLSESVEMSSSSSANKHCFDDEQTTIPQRVFNSLIQNKGALEVDHHKSKGELTLTTTEPMIGNCNNMLSFEYSEPKKGLPYRFSVSVKKGKNCKKESGYFYCDYKVIQAKNSIASKKPLPIRVRADYYGFKECLIKTGVYTKNGFDPSRIAAVTEEITGKGAYKSGPLVYHCYGPLCDEPGMRLSKKSLYKGDNKCDYFEPIRPKSYQIISKDDADYNRKKNLYNQLCNSKDHELIERNLSSFDQFSNMQENLFKIRNQLIKEDVAVLSHQLSQTDDYSDFDSKKFKESLSLYHEKIIKPLSDEIMKQVKKLRLMKSSAQKKEQREYISELVGELRKYAEIINKELYKNMKSFKTKAPLDEKEWRDSTFIVYKMLNTAYHLSRFSTDPDIKSTVKKRHLKRTAKTMMKENQNAEKEKLHRIGILAKDKKGRVSFSRQYKKNAQSVVINHRKKIQRAQQDYRKLKNKEAGCYRSYLSLINPMIQQYCLYKTQKKQKNLLQDMSYWQSSEYIQNRIYPRYEQNMELSNQWASVEADRNALFGIRMPRSSDLPIDPAALRKPSFSDELTRSHGMTQEELERTRYYQLLAMQELKREAFYNQSRIPSSSQSLDYLLSPEERFMRSRNFSFDRDPIIRSHGWTQRQMPWP